MCANMHVMITTQKGQVKRHQTQCYHQLKTSKEFNTSILRACSLNNFVTKPLVSRSAIITSISIFSITICTYLILSLTAKYLISLCFESLHHQLYLESNTIETLSKYISMANQQCSAYKQILQPYCLIYIIASYELCLHGRGCIYGLLNTLP